jgi:hypothetical protein
VALGRRGKGHLARGIGGSRPYPHLKATRAWSLLVPSFLFPDRRLETRRRLQPVSRISSSNRHRRKRVPHFFPLAPYLDRLHDRQIGRKAIDRGVVAALETDDEVRVGGEGQRTQHLRQGRRA